MATQGSPRKRADKTGKEKAAEVADVATQDVKVDETAIEEAEVILPEPDVPLAEERPEVSATAKEGPSLDSEEKSPVKKDAPPSEPPPPMQVTPTVVKASPGFIPLVLGGVVAAGLGFGLARFVPEGWPAPGMTPLQDQVDAQTTEIADLRSALQSLPKESSATADIAALNTELAADLNTVRDTANKALETAQSAQAAISETPTPTAGEDFGPRLMSIEERLTSLETRPANGGGADPAALAEVAADVAALQAALEAQKAEASAAGEQAEAARLETEAQAQTTLLQAALAKVEAAVESGAPFLEHITQLSDAGIAIPAALSESAEVGVPTTASLAESFDDPARAALEESLRGNMGSTWTERFGSFLRSQTGARSLTPREGDDPDAVLSRANAAVTAGDIATALVEITALPEAAQAALAPWVEQANLSLNAKSATADLAAALSER